jgi:hypothetical protein
MAAEAAAIALREGGVSIEITLLAANGYHCWRWLGTPSEAQMALAAAPTFGAVQ